MPYMSGVPQPRIYYKASPRCSICQKIVHYPELKGKIESTTSFKPTGRKITPVQTEYGINPPSWYGHLKHHHNARGNIAKAEINEDTVEIIEKAISAETSLKDNYMTVWDEIINQGLQEVVKGNLEITGSMLTKVLADKANHVSKKQDQKLDVAKMMFAFSSGKTATTEKQ